MGGSTTFTVSSPIGTPNRKLPKLYDPAIETAKTIPQQGKAINAALVRLETALLPVALQAFGTDTVTVTGPFRVGTLVQQQNQQNAVVADATKKIYTNAIVIAIAAGNKAIIANLAKLSQISIVNVPSVQGIQKIYLANSGNITANEPTTGFVQDVGFITIGDRAKNIYSIVFTPGITAYAG